MTEESGPDGADDSTVTVDDGSVPPEEAFAALGSEQRVAILRVLAAAARREETPLSFSDLYDRVGVDSSGRSAIDWGVYGVPETFIVDAEGIVRHKHIGPIEPGQIGAFLEALRAAMPEAMREQVPEA